MKRPSYKTKWLEADLEAKEQRERAEYAERQLKEWNQAGAVVGEVVLKEIDCTGKENETILLEPLDYLCAQAFVEMNQRVTYDHRLSEGYSILRTWKGRPIQRKVYDVR